MYGFTCILLLSRFFFLGVAPGHGFWLAQGSVKILSTPLSILACLALCKGEKRIQFPDQVRKLA